MTSKIAYLNLTHFGLKIKHKIPPRRSQDAHMTPQEDPRRSKTSSRRLQDASKTTPRRLPDASRYSQDALKTALNLPRHPKMLPRRPKTPQDVSKTPPDLDVGVSRPEFLEIFLGLFMAAHDATKTAQDRPNKFQDRLGLPMAAQDGTKTAQDGPRGFQDRPEMI